MFILFDIYIFIAWIGAWSAYSGASAFVVAIGWTVFVAFAIFASFFGGLLALILAMCGRHILAPLIGFMAWILYFFGLGDWMAHALPGLFPSGGYLFTSASAAWYEHLILWLWILMRMSALKFMMKC